MAVGFEGATAGTKKKGTGSACFKLYKSLFVYYGKISSLRAHLKRYYPSVWPAPADKDAGLKLTVSGTMYINSFAMSRSTKTHWPNGAGHQQADCKLVDREQMST